jgi:ATP-dependent DNA helicase RecG
MNRLLQGDVGSGKTVIAAAAAYISIKNGLPAVIMAPTEILAGQHAQSLGMFLKPHGIEISLQTRSSKAVIKPGQIIVGTHAVLHRSLPGEIGFIAIDEQHRFGVEQRARLLKRATTPHVLSMTATPIPRTIALSLYADLDISLIDEMPPGRIPVKTWVVPPSKRQNAYQWILSQVTDHHAQVFIVCPFITESENPELDQVKAAESEFEIITNQVFPHLRVGLLHGRLSAKDKAAVTNSFAHHQLDVLISTPVVEVGVDIPAATIMFIEGAERFGLASLHQLRGRVGRSDIQSYCLLFTTGDRIPKRLKYLESINSGMILAELDLKIRGPGELYGLKQSGYINLKLASLTDTKLIATTQNHAAGLVQHDPRLTHYPLLTQEIKTSLAKMTSPN